MCKVIYKQQFIVFFLSVLKLTPILIQTLLTTPSNGIAYIMKQFPWYLSTFMFDDFSQIIDLASLKYSDCVV